ncbi:hypothetical protein [Nocardiopsis tropica]|uniref:Insecticidal crystal toxin domain-containing protein n=1 Tax=Nocardiopsis tropica TaxID=109330 RepID=A0ABU7KY07_9ACTN|nr:hypothetical protein [Nocardiopsis umidischolae]MEE2054155.1 hypothetical protein [Nocardiopsis umidischolae]
MTYSKPCVFGELTLVFSTNEKHPPSPDYFASTGLYKLDGLMMWLKSTNPESKAVIAAESRREIKMGNASSWRLQPPPGYRALSDDPSASLTPDGYYSAGTTACVKETINGVKYVVPGEKGYSSDSALIGHMQTDRPKTIIEKNTVMVAPETTWHSYYKFLTLESGEEPGEVYVLNLPLPVVKGGDLARPRITDPNNVPSEQSPVIDREVIVPCMAVKDRGKSLDWILQNSPTYTLRRRRSYSLVATLDLRGSSQGGDIRKKVAWGVSKTQTETYSQSTSVTVGYESGIQIEGIGGSKISASITQSMGYEQSFSTTDMRQEEVEVGGNAGAGKVTAMYSERHVVYAVRNDTDHTFCSDDERNVVAFNAGMRYAIVDSSNSRGTEPLWHGAGPQLEEAMLAHYDGQVPEGLIRATSAGAVHAEVPTPDQLTGPHAPEGAPKVPQQARSMDPERRISEVAE